MKTNHISIMLNSVSRDRSRDVFLQLVINNKAKRIEWYVFFMYIEWHRREHHLYGYCRWNAFVNVASQLTTTSSSLTLIPVIMINNAFHNLQLDWILLFYWILSPFHSSQNLIEKLDSEQLFAVLPVLLMPNQLR